MDAYCARCNVSTEQIDEVTVRKGECPDCGGQIAVGGVNTDLPVAGAVAMSFSPGSRVAAPLDAMFEQSSLDVGNAGGDSKGRSMADEETQPAAARPPPPPADELFTSSDSPDTDAEEASASAPTARLPNEPIMPSSASVDSGSSSPTPPPPPNEAAEGEESPPAPEALESQETVSSALPAHLAAAAESSGVGVEVELPAPQGIEDEVTVPSSPSSINDQVADSASPPADDSPVGEEEQPSSSAPEAGAGLHLQLPAIDFSLPSAGGGDEASSEAPAAASEPAAAPSSLPAHLQLPSFPAFELPPIPGAETEQTTGEFDIEGVSGGSFGLESSGEGATAPLPATEPDAPDQWAVSSAENAGAAAPPPMPAPPPLPPKRQAPQQAAAPAVGGPGPLPNLPAFGLPAMAQGSEKREPTLLKTSAAIDISETRKKRSFFSVLFIGLFVLAGLGAAAAAGTVAFMGVDDALALIGQKKKGPTGKTAADKAAENLEKGLNAFKRGGDFEKAKKKRSAAKEYKAAIKFFNDALKNNPKHAVTHRAVAITYAKTGKEKQAIDHYRLYVKLAPKASDVAKVKKIIADYEKANSKKK